MLRHVLNVNECQCDLIEFKKISQNLRSFNVLVGRWLSSYLFLIYVGTSIFLIQLHFR